MQTETVGPKAQGNSHLEAGSFNIGAKKMHSPSINDSEKEFKNRPNPRDSNCSFQSNASVVRVSQLSRRRRHHDSSYSMQNNENPDILNVPKSESKSKFHEELSPDSSPHPNKNHKLSL